MLPFNAILDVDSYKSSHYLQYPPGTEECFFYLESRGGEYDSTVFFGLQYILKNFADNPITMEQVEEAKLFFEAHGEPFNYEGWKYIVEHHKGKLPIRIRAVPEGSVIKNHNVLMTISTTDPKAVFLASWLETALMRVWYPITVATQSYNIKQTLIKYCNITSEDPASQIDFKLHDFGARGVSSRESAGIGGAAHLTSFMGSDTVEGVRFANHYYNHDMAGFSIPAAEHSTITSWGQSGELDAYKNMLKQFAKPGKILAVVSDSYNLFNAIDMWGTTLKEEVINSGATLVVRPDSGDPQTIVVQTVQALMKHFGFQMLPSGYKLLPQYVRVIQGDGVNHKSIEGILQGLIKHGLAIGNVSFGMGGALLQQVNRDTQKFAIKLSNIKINGESIGVNKNPQTDPGKASKKGKLDLIQAHDDNVLTVQESPASLTGSMMNTVFLNGELKHQYTLKEIRDRINKTLL